MTRRTRAIPLVLVKLYRFRSVCIRLCQNQPRFAFFPPQVGRIVAPTSTPATAVGGMLAYKQCSWIGRVSNDQSHLVSTPHKATAHSGKGDHRSSGSRRIFESG